MNAFNRMALIALILIAHSQLMAGNTLQETIRFATVEEGQKLLTTEDDYTAKWSEFDIQSRLQDTKGNRAELMTLMSKQVRGWTAEEEAKVRKALIHIDSIIAAEGFILPLPEKIMLVKSTLVEEGGAGGYTRQRYIVLRPDLFFRDNDMLQHILLHEIFHVLTRNDDEFRRDMYRIIGFRIDAPMEYPAHLAPLRITNPDAHACDSYIKLTRKDSTQAECLMLLYADKPYAGGTFFQYIKIGFLETYGEGSERKVRYDEGKPVIHPIDGVLDFLDIVGRNTQYVIHPEEILADNFSYAFQRDVERPDPQIINEIQKLLRND